jgi:hypothetical protein
MRASEAKNGQEAEVVAVPAKRQRRERKAIKNNSQAEVMSNAKYTGRVNQSSAEEIVTKCIGLDQPENTPTNNKRKYTRRVREDQLEKEITVQSASVTNSSIPAEVDQAQIRPKRKYTRRLQQDELNEEESSDSNSGALAAATEVKPKRKYTRRIKEDDNISSAELKPSPGEEAELREIALILAGLRFSLTK